MSSKGTLTLEPVIGTPTLAAPCRHSLQITIPGAAIDVAIATAEKRYFANAKIPGFRPGKAPLAVVRKRFAERIQEEVRQDLVNESLRTAMQNEAVKPVTMPELLGAAEIAVKPGQDLTFVVEYDIAPEFEMPEYKGIALERRIVTIDDSRIDAAIDEVRAKRATLAPVEREAAKGDVLSIGYTSTLADASDEVPAPAKRLLNASEQWIMLDAQEIIPGVTDALIGKSKGDVVTLDVTFPADYHEPFLAGKQASYSITVLETNSYVLPEVNDEFAQSLGFENLEALRALVSQRLTSDVEQMQASALNAQLFSALIANATFDLPKQVLAREQSIVLNDLSRRHQDEHHHAEGEACAHGEEMQEQAAKTAVDRLRFQYIVEKIAEAEGLSVQPQEIQQQLEQFRQQRKLTIQKFQQSYNIEALAGMIEWELLRERALAHLVTLATITDKSVESEGAEAAAEAADDVKNAD